MAIVDPLARRIIGLLFAIGGFGPATAAAVAFDDETPRSAEAILRDIDAIPWPGFLSGMDAEKMKRALRVSTDRTIELVEELRRHHATHPRLPEEMRKVWFLMRNVDRADDRVFAETSRVLESDASNLRSVASFHRADTAMELPAISKSERMRWIEEALRDAAEEDGDWSARLLLRAAQCVTSDVTEQRKYLKRILEEHSDAGDVAKEAIELHAMLKSVGSAIDFAPATPVTEDAKNLDRTQGRPMVLVFLTAWSLDEEDPAGPDVESFLRAYEAKSREGVRFVVFAQHSRGHFDRLKERLAALGIEAPIFDDPVGLPEGFASPDGEERERGVGDRLKLRGGPWFVLVDDGGVVRRFSMRATTLFESS